MATQQIRYHIAGYPQASLPPGELVGWRKTADQTGNFLIAYWAHFVTFALGLLVFIAISIPFLSYLGLDAISKPLFFSLHYFCAQIPSHSFYLFGHQLGLCARNFSIYTSMFLGSLIFVLSKKRIPGIPWWIWLLLILPMAWDGTTQLFGLRESDWILRLLTGTLFGLGNIWFALPLMHKSLLETVPAGSYEQYKAMQMQPAANGPVAYQSPVAENMPTQILQAPATALTDPTALDEPAPEPVLSSEEGSAAAES